MTNDGAPALEKLRALLLEVESEIGRNVCADPVIDIILTVAVDNARGRFPTVNETILAAGAASETTRRFVNVLIKRQTLIKGDNGGLVVNPRIQSILATGLTQVCG